MRGSDSRPRILAVDDDPVILRLLSHILVPAGYQVLERPGAPEARKALEDGGISLLITDLNMPGGTGLDLARDLRRRNADLPVIILSGSIDEETVRAADELGRVLCMGKPLDQSLLLEAVRELTAPRNG